MVYILKEIIVKHILILMDLYKYNKQKNFQQINVKLMELVLFKIKYIVKIVVGFVKDGLNIDFNIHQCQNLLIIQYFYI